MAKRINFTDIEVDENQTLDSIVGDNQQTIVRNKDGDYEVITGEKAREKNLSDIQGIVVNQTPIEKGSVKKKFLMEDLKLIKKYFMGTFPDLKTREVFLDDELNWVKFKNFPLPDYFVDVDDQKVYYQPDKEDIVLVISEYPQDGPYGIHVKRDSPNKDKIRKSLAGHIFENVVGPDDYVERVQELSNMGWDWVCFHYARGQHWQFNRQDMRQGDCLAKYVENLFAALSGAFLKP